LLKVKKIELYRPMRVCHPAVVFGNRLPPSSLLCFLNGRNERESCNCFSKQNSIPARAATPPPLTSHHRLATAPCEREDGKEAAEGALLKPLEKGLQFFTSHFPQ